MADGILRSVVRAGARVPVFARVLLVYALARVATTALLEIAARLSGPGSRFGADASLVDFVLGWDAQWYWLIALDGYPEDLPRTDAGAVAENAWAFMPVYAFAAKLLGVPLGAWGAGAMLLSLLAGAAACLLLHALLRPRIGSAASLWAVAFFASGPTAALFHVGYAEALFFALLLGALLAVDRRRYGWLHLLVPVMGFTRPGVLAVALFLGLHGIVRWVRRRDEPLPLAHVVHILVAGAIAVVVGFAWQVIVAVVTGEPNGYLETELSWRRNWIAGGVDGFIPFQGWVQGAAFWFGHWGLPTVLGPVVLVIAAVGIGWLLLRDLRVGRLGADIRLWSASYLLYLLAVFFPQSSTLRLLLPLTPLWGAPAQLRSRWAKAGVLALCLVAQWLWIDAMYAHGATFWQVP